MVGCDSSCLETNVAIGKYVVDKKKKKKLPSVGGFGETGHGAAKSIKIYNHDPRSRPPRAPA